MTKIYANDVVISGDKSAVCKCIVVLVLLR